MSIQISKGEAARKKIIDEALKLFAKNGFGNTSFQDIAIKAKMKQTALFHYFDNKYSLYQACVERVLVNFEGVLKARIAIQDSAGERLKKNLLANLEWIEKNPHDSALLIFLYYTSTHDREFKAMYTSLLGKVRSRYLELVYAGQREGLFKPKIDADLAAEQIHEMVLGTLINIVAADQQKDSRARLIKKWNFGIESILGFKPGLK